MKKIMILINLLISISGFSQDSLLNYFQISETPQHTLLLRWEIKSGNTCNGMEIFHSTNDTTFESKETIPGICGSSASPVAYQWEDLNPVSNSMNYYKIQLGTGESGRSINLFFVDLNTQGYFLFPNPAGNQIKIYFENKNEAEAKIQLMNASGQIYLIERVNTPFWEPDLSNFPAGHYIFSIEIEQSLTIGRFVKN